MLVSRSTRLRLVFSMFASCAITLPAMAACDAQEKDDNDDDDDDGDDDDDDDGPKDGICGAAEAVDDACEAVHGEDVEACKPFDDVDEACEAGTVIDECKTASELDEACEALFGKSTAECAPVRTISEGCGQ